MRQKIINIKIVSQTTTAILLIIAVFIYMSSLAFAQIDVGGNVLNQKVADGEPLNISVKLSNFGGGKRIDVLVGYTILDVNEEEIYSTSDTVAVETTANFIKTLHVPSGIMPGTYIVKTSIIYQGQIAPAISQFPFIVERKILGLYQSDFLLWGGMIIITGILLILLGRMLIKRRREIRLVTFDYPDVSHDMRIFYEIISDTIMQMRQRAGDEALSIALHIEGLKIDEKNGRVISFTEKPSKIIANLVSEYENLLGKKVSFIFRRERTDL